MYPIKDLVTEPTGTALSEVHGVYGVVKLIWNQTVPLFQRPHAENTLKLCYLMFILFSIGTMFKCTLIILVCCIFNECFFFLFHFINRPWNIHVVCDLMWDHPHLVIYSTMFSFFSLKVSGLFDTNAGLHRWRSHTLQRRWQSASWVKGHLQFHGN